MTSRKKADEVKVFQFPHASSDRLPCAARLSVAAAKNSNEADLLANNKCNLIDRNSNYVVGFVYFCRLLRAAGT